MTKTKPQKFSEETIQSLKELGEILLRIRKRLVSEGKAKIENGKIVIIKQ
jgi:hypothetical protein